MWYRVKVDWWPKSWLNDRLNESMIDRSIHWLHDYERDRLMRYHLCFSAVCCVSQNMMSSRHGIYVTSYHLSLCHCFIISLLHHIFISASHAFTIFHYFIASSLRRITVSQISLHHIVTSTYHYFVICIFLHFISLLSHHTIVSLVYDLFVSLHPDLEFSQLKSVWEISKQNFHQALCFAWDTCPCRTLLRASQASKALK